ncbi:response regulator [bacterium]|jgi:two-component system chemotaxis response regulator CheY|nr:response regulator [bacterium]
MNKTLHFLVVDDDADSLKTIIEYLKSMGFEKVTQARDGAEALQLLEKLQTINFIISDWDMPNLNGLNLLQQIRSNPAFAQIPYLIVTSPISQETEKIVLAAESMVNAYLIKPFRSQVLKDKIERTLELSVRGPQKQVVVVDDDADALSMVMEYLNKLGFRDIKAFNEGASAVEYMLQNHESVSIVISDWEMPGMSGVELLRTLRSHTQLHQIPFLMITSQSSMDRMKVMQAARANVDQYLLKPFTVSDLKKRVDLLLKKSVNLFQIENLVSEAAEHYSHGRFQKAFDLFDAALKIDGAHEVALAGMADVLVKLRGVQAALPFYKKAIDSNSVNPQGYARLASAYEQIGLLDKAIAIMQSGVRNVSFSAELHFQLGRVYNKAGMIAEARVEFEKTLEIQLDHKEARLMLELLNERK